MYIYKYFYGQFFFLFGILFFTDVTLIYYYFGDHKVVLILLRDLFLKVLSQI